MSVEKALVDAARCATMNEGPSDAAANKASFYFLTQKLALVSNYSKGMAILSW